MVRCASPVREISMGEGWLPSQGDIHRFGVPSLSGRYPWLRCAFLVRDIYMVKCAFTIREIAMGVVCLLCQGDIHG